MKNVSFGAAICLLTGCSLINSLDDVKPEAKEVDGGSHAGKGGKGSGGTPVEAGEAGGAAGKGGTAGKGGAGGGAGGAAGAAAGGTDAGMDASDSSLGMGGSIGSDGGGAGGTGPTDSGSDAFTSGGPTGAIVTYDPTNKKLDVLDPQDGHLVSSETSPRLLAIANDPISDVWYLFQQPGTVFSGAQLQVRLLETKTGRWRNVGKPVAVPNPAVPSIGVLNKRIAYLSTPDPTAPDQTASTLTVLDTSKPDAVVVIGTKTRVLPAGGKLALIANPDGANTGGTATIALQAACGATECDVSLFRESISESTIADDPAGAHKVGSVNPTGGGIGFAYDFQNRYDVLVMPPVNVPAGTPTACQQNQGVTGSALEFDPATHNALVGPAAFDIASLRVSGAAFDSCHQIAFATSLLNDTAVWAIPFVAGGTPQKLCAQGAASMYFEPYTHALLRVPTAGDRIEAYDIDATNPAAPTIKSRSMKLPAAFSITTSVLAVRQPLTGFCN